MQRLLDAHDRRARLRAQRAARHPRHQPLGRALYSPVFADPASPANLARFIFLDPPPASSIVDWDDIASTTVGILRTEAGRDPSDRDPHRPDRRAVHPQRAVPHPLGRPQRPPPPPRLNASATPSSATSTSSSRPSPSADPGLTITAYTAEPGTPSHDALALLASWAATHQRADVAQSSQDDHMQGTAP